MLSILVMYASQSAPLSKKISIVNIPRKGQQSITYSKPEGTLAHMSIIRPSSLSIRPVLDVLGLGIARPLSVLEGDCR